MIGQTMAPKLTDFRRVVIKVGSSLLVDSATGKLRTGWLAALAEDVSALASEECSVLVVSSGAIALGRYTLGLPGRTLKLEEAQAAAAVGQVALSGAWSQSLEKVGLTTAQILLTLSDTEERRRYLNARATLATLLDHAAIPVINENDTVATSEIRYGDNDRLAARVAAMIGADCLVLLSDVDGLYTTPPASNPEAEFVPHVSEITPVIEAMAGAEGSGLSRGGMRTKIEAAKIATAAGAAMAIVNGHELHPIRALNEGVSRATWFDARATPASARKAWIASHLEICGKLVVDDGAARALKNGKSLLAAGVAAVTGGFSRGDAVVIVDSAGREQGRGLVGYDSADAQAIAGRRSGEIEGILGYPGRAALIHRDDMVLRD